MKLRIIAVLVDRIPECENVKFTLVITFLGIHCIVESKSMS